MNIKNDKSSQPRRTSTKEASERSALLPVAVQEKMPESLNVQAILADAHPMNGEDYAVQLFYKSKENHRSLNFQLTRKSLAEDNETASLVVNSNKYEVNIRTGVVKNLGAV